MNRPPRRLLLIINRLVPVGGAETQLAYLAKGLAARGHEVTLCCIDSSTVDPAALAGRASSWSSCGVRRLQRRLGGVLRMARLARRADLVHCTMWDAASGDDSRRSLPAGR